MLSMRASGKGDFCTSKKSDSAMEWESFEIKLPSGKVVYLGILSSLEFVSSV